MKEESIRPASIFSHYRELAKADCQLYFGDKDRDQEITCFSCASIAALLFFSIFERTAANTRKKMYKNKPPKPKAKITEVPRINAPKEPDKAASQ